ncbi:MAG: RluA family pseudouridine synthase [Pigmentiphaga sp.]|nr:RluA family pseudouridine synthase [Pigmentiphaga sp.]
MTTIPLPPLPSTDPPDDAWEEAGGRRRLVVASGGRLDKVLATLLPEHSRSRLQGWIEAGFVAVNGRPEQSVRRAVSAGDRLDVAEQATPEQLAFSAEPVEFSVVAESHHWLVVDKPVGLVVHPGAGNWSGTLLNGLLHRYPELRQVARAGIVHRLDKDTSGLMVVARTEIAQTSLVRQLQERTVGREYVALAQGQLWREQTLDWPIGRDARVPVRMSASHPVAAKPAITHVVPERQGMLGTRAVTRVACRLETGRTHQIRVHLAQAGHPLVADLLYGGSRLAPAQRQMLHARRLAFDDPLDGGSRVFESSLPADMQAVFAAVHWNDA